MNLLMTITIDSDQLTKLIRNPIIIRIVSELDIATLSILELLEYNLTRKDINYALLNGVIAVDKSAASSTAYEDIQHIQDLNILISGDFYFHNFLNSKVRLTDVGPYSRIYKRHREAIEYDIILPRYVDEQKQNQRQL